MEETAIAATEPETALKVDVEGLPLLLGLGGFKPTTFQAQAVYLFLTSTENKPIHQIVGEITYDASLWYKWKKRSGFMEWFDKVCHSTFSSEKLLDVHAAVYRRAMGNSPADAKLFLQRFDPAYTERSQSDQRVSFQGYDPPAAADSRERQRKALVKQGQSLPVVQGDAREPALLGDNGGTPDNRTRATAHDQTGDTKPISRGCQVYGVSTPAIQAQSHDEQHKPGMDEQASDDNTLDFEPITKVDPPAPGLQE